MSAQSFFTTGDGVRVAYRLDGDAALPVLVLSNSIGTTLHMWDGEVAALSRAYRALRYDTRGHGASGVPEGAYSLDRLGRDVIEMMDALDIRRAHFLGLSLGGIIGQWLGVHASERIDRLVLANTSDYLGPPAQWDARIAATLQAPDATLQAPDMTETAQTFLGNWFPASMLQAGGPVIDAFRAMLLATDPKGLAGAFAAVRDMDLRRTNALINRPTLVIAGRDDTVTAASHGERIAATVPGAELRVLPTVHLSNVERPAEFLDAVLTFLAQGDRG